MLSYSFYISKERERWTLLGCAPTLLPPLFGGRGRAPLYQSPAFSFTRARARALSVALFDLLSDVYGADNCAPSRWHHTHARAHVAGTCRYAMHPRPSLLQQKHRTLCAVVIAARWMLRRSLQCRQLCGTSMTHR